MKENKRFLVVTGAFRDYRRGDVITDKEEIEKTLKENEQHVVVSYAQPDLTLSKDQEK